MVMPYAKTRVSSNQHYEWVAKKSGLPVLALIEIQKCSCLPTDLNKMVDADWIFLMMVHRMWGRRELLRLQLARISKIRRQEMLIDIERTRGLSRWESYAYRLFLGGYQEGKKADLVEVQEKITNFYGKAYSAFLLHRLKILKRRAYDRYRYERKVGDPCRKEAECEPV
jgi:hypothetical protein